MLAEGMLSRSCFLSWVIIAQGSSQEKTDGFQQPR